MENKLKKLFDYQRFEQNDRLAKLIGETEARQTAELFDEDLELVAAAGNIFEQNNNEKNEPEEFKIE